MTRGDSENYLSFKARYDKWLRRVLILAIGSPLVIAILILVVNQNSAAIPSLVFTGAIGLTLWLLLPRAFEVWPDRLRIVLGWKFAWTIPLEEIEEICPTRGLGILVFWGVSFITSVKNPVRIKRTKGMDVLISPDEPVVFIENVLGARAILCDRER